MERKTSKIKIEPIYDVKAFLKSQLTDGQSKKDPMQYFKPKIAEVNKFAVGPSLWYVLDRHDYSFYAAGGNTILMFGFTSEELKKVGPEKILSLVHPDDLPYYLAYLDYYWNLVQNSPKKQQKNLKGSIYFRKLEMDGTYATWMLHIIDWLTDDKDQIQYTLTIVTDISHISPDMRVRLVILNSDDSTSSIYYSHTPETEIPHKTDIPKITRRQIEIISFLAKGMSSKMIAQILNLSVFTVNNHRQNLLKATGTPNVSALVRYAYEHGIIHNNSKEEAI